MPKINVYLPDELAEAVREAGVPVSAICQRALEEAVRRVTAIRETTLGDLEIEELSARLPRFTARAHAVLRLALDQARATGAPTVGTEHLLGALVAEGGNLALQVLRALEIEPEQINRDLARLAATAPQAAGDQAAGDQAAVPRATVPQTVTPQAPGNQVAKQFSGSAANALELTVTEATALGHNYIGCEHLLLGLVTEPDGTAGQVLRARGAEPRLTRRAVAAALAGYVHLRAQTGSQTVGQPGAAGQPGGPVASAEAMKALAAAVQQELRPLIERIERLEGLVGATTER